MDIVSPARRSRMMSGIRSSNTQPELVVRSTAHRMGLRFRLHRRMLPGSPDLVLPRWNLAIFVHGCFWHRHGGCRLCAEPKTRSEFWQAKFKANVARDREAVKRLKALGWRVEVIWECETKNADAVACRLWRATFGSSYSNDVRPRIELGKLAALACQGEPHAGT
ncbi:very short patch repair endonuclease [Luteimonas sp. SDU82]|uniref:very short patch repair endonuclease n=1 Tax=Luteimonas sp. SDU82 TaxID=3422592 RepID=UPI003EBCBAEB